MSRRSGHDALIAAWKRIMVSGLDNIYWGVMSTLVETSGSEIGVVVERHTNLTLDLLTCPSSSVASAAAKVCICARLPC
jgi:hypothetical protein